MAVEDAQPNPERENTDESLRAERQKADDALGEGPSPIDETADAVIERARSRADAVLAAARAKSDLRAGIQAPMKATHTERLLEDLAVRQEREAADEIVREERVEHAALLAAEREETDKDLSRERARADDAVSTRDEFLGMVSHDLRNMLSAIVGFAELVAREASPLAHGSPPSEKIVAYAKRIQRSGARMNRLVGDLVDLASIGAGTLAVRRELGTPSSIVTEAVDTFQTQALANGITLTAEIGSSLPLIAFDSARILQVLANLLGNAIKFTPPNGRVTVCAEHVAEDIRFDVNDTGIGVPPDQLEAVFERYTQIENDRRGVGLGLYISRCIIQGHGGKIWVESSRGQGSAFRFTLPVRVPPASK